MERRTESVSAVLRAVTPDLSMDLLFSVVIPTYNRAGEIRACLDSVLLAPRCENFEVIVVDDGSSDGTAEAVERYGDGVRLIRQRNRGAGAARNAGIRAARGEYVAFLDSDDLWFPHTLRNYARAIERAGRPSLLIGRPWPFAGEKPREIPAAAGCEAELHPSLQAFLLKNEPMMHATGTLVARREALLVIGGFAERRMNCEDTDLVLKLSAAPGFVFVRTPPAYAFRKSGHSLSASAEDNFRGISSVIDRELRGEYPGGAEGSKARWRLIGYVARAFSMKLARHGRIDLAFAVYRKVFRRQLEGFRIRYLVGFPIVALYWRIRLAVPRSGGA
jgi:glycosyltransferase involved in cell wall biosynthesis